MRQLATARQVLERACQQGTLTDEEVARTLQRLEPAPAEAK
jgi:hypothetical protein